MFEKNGSRHAFVSGAVKPQLSFWRKVWLVLMVVQARLRFVAIIAAIGCAIFYWETLQAHYEKWTRPAVEHAAASADTEYFCPMHPQIVRNHSKDPCPICFMPLSRRKKGDGKDEPLPAGIVSRVQLSPYRVALAGVHTWEVCHQPLTKEIATVGTVEFDERLLARIATRVSGRSRIDKLYVNVTGQMVHKGDPLALLYSPELVGTVQNLSDAQRLRNSDLQRMARDRMQLWGVDNDQIDALLSSGKPITHVTIRSPISGHVLRKYPIEGEYVEEGGRLFDLAGLSTVWIQAQIYEDELAMVKVGLPIRAVTSAYPNEEFVGKVALILPHLDQNSRTLSVRFDIDNPAHHLRPGMFADVKLQIPTRGLESVTNALAEEWRDRTAIGNALQAVLTPWRFVQPDALGSLPQMAGAYALLNSGQVLAVPESAVIDTGGRRIVYRRESPSVYEGVEVRLGPRMAGPEGVAFYPVLRGVEAGERVVTHGAFLIDAETRLNPAAGSIYYGGSAGKNNSSAASAVRPTTPADEDDDLITARAKLRPADRRLVEAQGYCPIQKNTRLGAMGTPLKIVLNGQPIFLCCRGCIKKAEADPDGTLRQVQQLKAKQQTRKSS